MAMASSGGASSSTTPSPSTTSTAKVEKEGVFEIRDFTTASSFERISHEISLAVKRWADALKNAEAKGEDEDGVLMRDGFEHNEFRYDLLFQIVRSGIHPVVNSKVGAGKENRLGVHAFPTVAHKLQRWFGVRHHLLISVPGQNVGIDSARTVLSAAALAVRSAGRDFTQPLSCFVPVDGGRRRFLGELLESRSRVIYTTDLKHRVSSSLEHLTGLAAFFWQKMEANPKDPNHTLMVGTRFTYSADHFDPLLRAKKQIQSATSCATGGYSAVGKSSALQEVERRAPGANEHDPVESVKLHCLWPSFPLGSFVDDASFSELDPRHAPYWKVRVLLEDNIPLPLSKRLQALLEFRNEARTVLSAEHSMQPQMPKTAFAGLTSAIQESLESILLPTPDEMFAFTEECMSYPVVPEDSLQVPHGSLDAFQAARSGDRLTRLAQLGSTMRCFKGTVMLWCNILARMRSQWDALERPGPGSASPPTRRISARGVRAELFDNSVCLVQQKMEILQRSVEECRRALAASSPSLSSPLEVVGTCKGGKPLYAPPLLQPALLTEDVVVQLDMAAINIVDSSDRAELHGKELRSDFAAFKDANPTATFEDLKAWRAHILGLSLDPFPEEWLQQLWNDAEPRPVKDQQAKLFEPTREAEMALHFLENVEGTQFLLQLFRVLLRSTLEELSASVAAGGGGPAYLRVLRDRAQAASLHAFTGRAEPKDEQGNSPIAVDTFDATMSSIVGDVAEFPSEGSLQRAISAIETFERATRLAASLRAKLPGQAEALLEGLLTEGEADVTTPMQRCVLEKLFERSRVLSGCADKDSDDEPDDARASTDQGIFEALPLAKEFILQLEPKDPSLAEGASKRLYAEVRHGHMRQGC
eukprot:TRINITY_DN14758_c0_g1_i2.p1 TRINITY_DN14758_c0_g1~~TRINITY_DN14758_c0_g1_i2.p1  ORF type:complete len:911 (+),score=172.86 TRINITY_DN14758_c0_g1_i2:117-2735(+)